MKSLRPLLAAGLIVIGVIAVIMLARTPRGAVPGSDGPPGAPTPTAASATLVLYFVAEDGRLRREGREVPEVPATTPGLIRLVLDELLTGSREGLTSPFPWATNVQAVLVDGKGTAYVDLSPPPSENPPTGSNVEATLVYAIVDSITANCRGIERVQILFGGREIETLGHLDLSRPLAASGDFVNP